MEGDMETRGNTSQRTDKTQILDMKMEHGDGACSWSEAATGQPARGGRKREERGARIWGRTAAADSTTVEAAHDSRGKTT